MNKCCIHRNNGQNYYYYCNNICILYNVDQILSNLFISFYKKKYNRLNKMKNKKNANKRFTYHYLLFHLHHN